MDCCIFWTCIFFVDISASWLISKTSMSCYNCASCLATCLFVLTFSILSSCSTFTILSSFSLSKVETSVALSIVIDAYAPMNCDSLVKFSDVLKGMSFYNVHRLVSRWEFRCIYPSPFSLPSNYKFVERAIEHIKWRYFNYFQNNFRCGKSKDGFSMLGCCCLFLHRCRLFVNRLGLCIFMNM